MNTRVYFILGFTFITGIFSGAYLYVTSFAPDYRQDDIEEVSEIGFKLQGEVYGGCQMVGRCASFTLEDTRKYELESENGRQDDETTMLKGRLHADMFDELVSVAELTAWSRMARKNERTCSSYVDGADYRYLLTYQGEQISLDTCGTEFGNSEVSSTFQGLWQEMENTESGAFLDDGIDGFLKDQLDKRFEYDNE